MEIEPPEPKQTQTQNCSYAKWICTKGKTRLDFTDDHSILIEKNYQNFLKNVGTTQFPIGNFLLDLKEMKALYNEDGVSKSLKLVRILGRVRYELSPKDPPLLQVPTKGNNVFDATPFLSKMVVAYFFRSVTNTTVWYPYSEDDNKVTERNYQLYLKDPQDKNYEINPERSVNFFHNYQFRTTKVSKKRSICRVVYGWFWSVSKEVWEPYPPHLQQEIETAYCNDEEKISLKLEHGTYNLNFVEMIQFNCLNHHKRRDIIRVGPKFTRKVIVLRPESKPGRKILFVPNSSYPEYWTTFDGFASVPLPEKSKKFKEIEQMMNKTIVSHTSGVGLCPGKNHQPTSFKIIKLLQIQSEYLWERYMIRKKHIFSKFSENYEKSEIFDHIKKHPLQLGMLDETVNEVSLFHGTSKEVADLITESGFDCRQGAEIVTGHPSNSMFGTGLYFAENSSKSNQYVQCPVCGGNSIGNKKPCTDSAESIYEAGGYTMILARVLLGDAQLCLEYDGKIYKKKEVAPLKADGTHYDSIFAERKIYGGNTLKYREFVVFDRSQIYPEFLIYYERL